jgi:hypothetical protein
MNFVPTFTNKSFSMKAINCLFFLFFCQNFLMAQSDNLYDGSGKIYIVIGVICLIFVGFILYLIRMDNKLSDLEKKMNRFK